LIKKTRRSSEKSSVDGETIEIVQEKQAMNELGVIIILLSIKRHSALFLLTNISAAFLKIVIVD